MGTRNRERRATKQRKRDGRRHNPRAGASWARTEGDDRAEAAMLLGAHAAAVGDDAALSDAAVRLATCGPAGARLLDHSLVQLVGILYSNGWQPADIALVARRRLPPAKALIAAVITEEAAHAGWSGAQLHRRWRAQLADLGAWPPPPGAASGALAPAVAAVPGHERPAVCAIAFRLLALLHELPRLAELLPPPGQAHSPLDADVPAGLDAKVLGKIRGLLAKAESTSFPEEAEALSAKAQLLMSRHAVDAVLVGLRGGLDEPPIGVRIAIEDPYADAKTLLLQAVAGANRCRPMWSAKLGFSSIVGFEADLIATELLFTSLLVQANKAMLGAVVPARADGRRRTTSFRRSFLVAYASRIGQRLAAATASAVDEATGAEADGALLPALVAREDRVERTMEQLFPDTFSRSVAVTHHGGWVAGSLAADLADLTIGAPLDPHRARPDDQDDPYAAQALPGAATWG
ncbi:MAG: DUF2786 domain-containing protein [Acidimicrobiia bacterium]|nr:DUF2786 domain-containing protein [Acidimicrobiia bacterium]